VEKRLQITRSGYSLGAEIVAVCFLSFCASLLIVTSYDLKFSYKAALAAGFIGIACIAMIPNRRIALVMVWILAHPLSLEKVLSFGTPLHPDFLPPQMVINASDLILAALFVYLCMEAMITRKNVWRFPTAAIPLAMFTFWTIFAFLFSSPSVNSGLAVVHNLKMLVFILVMVSAVRTPNEFKWVLVAVAVAVGFQALLVCMASVTARTFAFSSKLNVELMTFSGGHLRATGTVGHVNQEASFLTFFSLPLLGLMASGACLKRGAAWIVFSAAAIAIILTFSRSAWVALSVAALCLIVLLLKKRKIVFRHWVFVPPIVIAFFCLAIVFARPVIDRLMHGDEGATSSRMRASLLAWDLIKKHPVIGVGPWNFAKASLEEYPPSRFSQRSDKGTQTLYGRLEITQAQLGSKTYTIPLPVHNKYLLVCTELGGIGLILFLWFQLAVFNHIRKSLGSRDAFLQWSAMGIMVAFWAALAYMSLDLFSDDKTTQILLLVPVLAMIIYNLTQRDVSETR
jgi:O-antigen ligase